MQFSKGSHQQVCKRQQKPQHLPASILSKCDLHLPDPDRSLQEWPQELPPKWRAYVPDLSSGMFSPYSEHPNASYTTACNSPQKDALGIPTGSYALGPSCFFFFFSFPDFLLFGQVLNPPLDITVPPSPPGPFSPPFLGPFLSQALQRGAGVDTLGGQVPRNVSSYFCSCSDNFPGFQLYSLVGEITPVVQVTRR